MKEQIFFQMGSVAFIVAGIMGMVTNRPIEGLLAIIAGLLCTVISKICKP